MLGFGIDFPVGVEATKGAVKLHTLLDVRGAIPVFVRVSQGKVHDANSLDRLIPEAGGFYVMDRAHLDFSRLHVFHLHGGYFVLRSKSNLITYQAHLGPTVALGQGLRSWERRLPARGKLG